MTETLEEALRRSEQDARSAVLAAGRLVQAAKHLQKAATAGDLAQLHAAASRLRDAATDAGRSAEAAAAGWPWSDTEEEEFLRADYMTEVQEAASAVGIQFHHYGDSWSAYPVLLRVEPKTKSIRVDRRRVKALRPSILVRKILQVRQAKPRQTSEQFLEILYAGYQSVLGRQAVESGVIRPEIEVGLINVHQALTLLPDARKEYPIDEFVRDLHQLNLSGLRQTHSGHMVFLAAATSTKSGAGVLTVVDDLGRPSPYFSVTFRKDN